MRKTFFLFFVGISGLAYSQDSTSVKASDVSGRKCTHEIGFNGTFLVKQLISDNPASTLAQLPYLVNYQVGFPNKMGIRVGLGFDQSVQKTSIQGQVAPRTTTVLTGSYRLDLCRQLLNYKKISCGMFFGVIMDHSKLESSTTTQSSFGSTTQSDLTNKSVGYGGEIGLGVKFSFNQHIGIGTEIPLQCKYTKTNEFDKQTFTSGGSTSSTQTISDGSLVTTKIFLPTSIFICITF